MAVVVKNTFLQVEHKFLHCDEPSRTASRSLSVPRSWKAPEMVNERASTATSSDHQVDISSNLSFYSPRESSCDWEGAEEEVAIVPSMEFCMTPTSSCPGTPRETMGCTPSHSYWLEVGADACSEIEEFSCSRCHTGGFDMVNGLSEEAMVSANAMVSNVNIGDAEFDANMCTEPLTSTPIWQQAYEMQEPENEPETLVDVEHPGMSAGVRTKLKTDAPAFEPGRNDAPIVEPRLHDARLEAIVSCVHIALMSCGQIRNVKIERGLAGASSMLVFAELHDGPHAPSRSYDVMQLSKQALDAITARLPTTTLLSSRVQKEDCGYSLRSSIACSPEHVQGSVCWDMFRKGYCPRREQCRWYHPQDADIARIKVCVRYTEDVTHHHVSVVSHEEKVLTRRMEEVMDIPREEQLMADSSYARHKISIGELANQYQ